MRRLVVSDILRGLRKRKVNNDEAAMNYKTVGLIGLCSGAGTTQLGIMLANYFSNGLHLKTAIVSAGFDDSFDRIKEEEQVGKVRNYAGSRRGFSYKGIDFFGGVREGFAQFTQFSWPIASSISSFALSSFPCVKKLTADLTFPFCAKDIFTQSRRAMIKDSFFIR